MRASFAVAALFAAFSFGASGADARTISYSYVGAPVNCDPGETYCEFRGMVFTGGFEVDTGLFASGGVAGASFSFSSRLSATSMGYDVSMVATRGGERVERMFTNNRLDVATDGVSVSGMFAEFLFGNVGSGVASFSLDDLAQMASSSGDAMLGGSNDYMHRNGTEFTYGGRTNGGGQWTRSPAVIPLPASILALVGALGALGAVRARRRAWSELRSR